MSLTVEQVRATQARIKAEWDKLGDCQCHSCQEANETPAWGYFYADVLRAIAFDQIDCDCNESSKCAGDCNCHEDAAKAALGEE